MVHQTPWLLTPTQEDRDALARLTGASGLDELTTLRSLANRAWIEGELRSIGRKVRKLLSSGDWQGWAKGAGFTKFSLLIISSNTVNHLTDALIATALRAGILLDCRIAEYEEPESWLADNELELAAKPPDATLLAMDRKMLHLHAQAGDAKGADAVVESAIARLQAVAAEIRRTTSKTVIVQTIAFDAADPQLSMDAWLDGSPRLLIARFNHELVRLARTQSLLLFDVAAIADLVGHATWTAGRYWYTVKMPFAPACIPLYAHRLFQLIAATLGKSRRALVLDLDNTLWGGVIGDDGINGIVLGAGNAVGEAHLAIQRMALDFKSRGIALCISSKNTDEIARDVFLRHPEMLLRENDITLFQINWDDKASNIRAIADAMDLGLDAFVLLDDNPAERKQVRDLLPMVAVPELPHDPANWLPVIQAAGYFEQISFSQEDKARANYYKGNAERSVQAQKVGDPQKFLESLKMEMAVSPFDAVGRSRIAQLISKSNQFNLTTRRYSEAEVGALEARSDKHTMQVRLADIFGDNGMIAVVICDKQKEIWEIDTWLMSCRVLGRGVEQAMLANIAQRAKAAGAKELRGRFIPTPKNGIVRDHYSKLGFEKIEETAAGETVWRLALANFAPKDVPIRTLDTGDA